MYYVYVFQQARYPAHMMEITVVHMAVFVLDLIKSVMGKVIVHMEKMKKTAVCYNKYVAISHTPHSHYSPNPGTVQHDSEWTTDRTMLRWAQPSNATTGRLACVDLCWDTM